MKTNNSKGKIADTLLAILFMSLMTFLVTNVFGQRVPENPVGTIAGVDYKYYQGSWSVLPNFSTLTPIKTGYVSTFSITPKNRNDNFGFEFTGFVSVPTDGTYTFYTSSDDGSNLFIGTTQVVSNDGLHGIVERSGTIALNAGKHAIRVVFFERTGGENLTVSYAGPNITKIAIPASSLFRMDMDSPTAPTNLLSSSLSATSFTLNWTASSDNSGAVTYEVYRNGTSIGTTTTTSLEVSGLTCATTYTMTVNAKDVASNTSAASMALNVTTSTCSTTNLALNKTITASSSEGTGFEANKANDGNAETRWASLFSNPQWIYVDLGASYSITRVRLTWEVAYASSYQIQTSPDASTWTPIYTTTTGDGGIDDLTGLSGTGRYIRMYGTVRGTVYGYSLFEFEVYGSGGGGDTQAPSVPTVLASSSIAQTSFALSWTASTDNVGVASYEVFRGITSCGTTTSTSLSVTGLTCNTLYSMTVKAKDAAGNVSVASSNLNVTTSACPEDTLAPSDPAGLASSGITSSSFTLSWTASTDNIGVATYEVFRNGSTSCGTTTSLSLGVYGLNASTTYTMTVKANDAAGNVSAASASLNVTTSTISPPSGSNLIGINLGWSNIDWSQDRMFANAFISARGPWYEAGAWGDPNPKANVDANYWPTEDACILLWDMSRMNGTYKVSFTGSASSITLGMTGGSIANKVYNSATNTTTCDMIITNSGPLTIQFTGTNGGVKNLKVMRPLTPGNTSSYPTTSLFTNEIKNFVSKFQVIRYMDYFNTNSNNLVTWNQRPLPTDASQNDFRTLPGIWGPTPVGGCIEYAIMFSNETGKDMWLNIPHKVNDDYITKLAQLLKYGSDGVNPYTSTQANPIYPPLNANLKVYVEWSNEVWNTATAFAQGNDNHDAAIAEVNAGNSPLNYEGTTNNWFWAWRRIGKKIVETSNIFRTVFGDAAMMTRIRPVLEGQQGGGSLEALTFIDQIYGKNTQWCTTPHTISYYLYGTGGSSYYNPDNHSDDLTIDNIWTNQTMDINNWMPTCRLESAIAHAFGLKRISYEGGPSLDNTGHSEAVKAASVNDSRMRTNMIAHFDNAWSATDGDLFTYYVSSGNYQWGFTDDMFNLNTIKLQAIDQLNTQNKAAASICSVPPVTLNGIDKESSWSVAGSSTWTNGNAFHVKEDAYVVYMFRVTTFGTYNVSAYMNGNTGPLYIVCDGVNMGYETQTNGNLPTYTMANLQPGLHTVMFKTTTGEAEIATVTIGVGAGTKNAGTIENVNQNNRISVYPNPTNNSFFTIALNPQTENENIQISMTDFSGKIVYLKSVKSDVKNIQISTEGFAKGLYLIQVSGENFINNSKIIIK